MNRNRFIQLLVVLGALSLGTGCKTKPATPPPEKAKAYKITLELDGSLSRAEVDVVGVNPNQRAQWNDKSMTEYWGDGDKLRANAQKQTVQLSTGNPSQSIPVDAPIWNAWLKQNGATEVIVLADLPDMTTAQDRPGAADARRKVLPLNPNEWVGKNPELKILVKRSGLEVVSQLTPR